MRVAYSDRIWTITGVILSAVAILVAIAVAVALGWLAWRVAYPRRKILYRMEIYPAVRFANSITRKRLTIKHGEVEMKNPHFATVELRVTGPKDLDPNEFGGHPLVFEFGTANVIEILGRRSSPKSTQVPALRAQGARLSVGPSLIRKRQKVRIFLLFEGEPSITCPPHRLPNIKVGEDPNISEIILWVWCIFLFSYASITIETYSGDPKMDWARGFVVGLPSLISFIIVVAITLGFGGYLEWKKRKL